MFHKILHLGDPPAPILATVVALTTRWNFSARFLVKGVAFMRRISLVLGVAVVMAADDRTDCLGSAPGEGLQSSQGRNTPTRSVGMNIMLFHPTSVLPAKVSASSVPQ